jgi:hypothetical protein
MKNMRVLWAKKLFSKAQHNNKLLKTRNNNDNNTLKLKQKNNLLENFELMENE